MAPRPKPWFRFYSEALHDRKLRRLAPAQRWLWVAVLCIARQSPIPGFLVVSEREPMHEVDIADLAGMSVKEVTKTLPLFEKSGMIERDANLGCWQVVNFAERQYESDTSTVRTRKHRSMKQARNVSTAHDGTAPETETESETEILTSSSKSKARGANGGEEEEA